jgi:hypothetical protein
MHHRVGLALFALSLSLPAAESRSVYREVRVAMAGNEWRVTDPRAGHEGAAKFLPNPNIEFTVGDLSGVRRAEIMLDRWGGHPGTSHKQIRINGHAWLDVPELGTTPEGEPPECFMMQDNPVIDVPLAHLQTGRNTLEGTSGDQVCFSFRWGQWGQNAAVLRLYYDDEPPGAHLSSPEAGAILGENPLIEVEVDNPAEVERVDVLAYYDGYDENGDGVFEDWHQAYFYNRRIEPTAADPELTGHVGTAVVAPFAVVWNTQWVPDHPDGSIKLIARVKRKDGTWRETGMVEGLSLIREEETVKLYKPEGVGQRHWVRAGRSAVSKVTIPAEDDVSLAVEASAHMRTWNGYRENFSVNHWYGAIGGIDHVYACTVRPVPVNALRLGEQVITYYSSTVHHGVEILWPGPALVVRYRKGDEH